MAKNSIPTIRLFPITMPARAMGDFPMLPVSASGGLMAQMYGMTVDMEIEGRVLLKKIEFPIDLAMLSGEADVRNPEGDALPQAKETSYSYKEIDFQPIVPIVDLDGDGNKDVVKLNQETHQLSFWFAGSDPENDPPNLTRRRISHPILPIRAWSKK